MFRWLEPILNPAACLPPAPAINQDTNVQALLARLETLLQQQFKTAFSGSKKSLLRGQGLDFADLREYVPGDDIRKMDWSVFARTLTPHIREYQEEKQLTLWLVIDCTESMQFGRQRSKLNMAVELAGLFALMTEQSGHRLGAFLIRNTGPEIISPKSGYAQVQHILKRIITPSANTATQSKTDPLPSAFQQLAHILTKNTSAIVLSDFLTLSPQWELPLGRLSRQTRMLYIHLTDPTELQLPKDVGILHMKDAESGLISRIDTADAKVRSAYQFAAQRHQNQIHTLLNQMGSVISASTDEALSAILLRILKHPIHRGIAS